MSALNPRADGAASAVYDKAQELELQCCQLADRCADQRLALRLRKLALALFEAQVELNQLTGFTLPRSPT